MRRPDPATVEAQAELRKAGPGPDARLDRSRRAPAAGCFVCASPTAGFPAGQELIGGGRAQRPSPSSYSACSPLRASLRRLRRSLPRPPPSGSPTSPRRRGSTSCTSTACRASSTSPRSWARAARCSTTTTTATSTSTSCRAACSVGKPAEDAIFPPRQPLPLTDRLYRNDLDGRCRRHAHAALHRRHATAAASRRDRLRHGRRGRRLSTTTADVDLYVTRLRPEPAAPQRRRRHLRRRHRATPARADDRAGAAAPPSSTTTATAGSTCTSATTSTSRSRPTSVCRAETGARDYCGPLAYEPVPDRLFRNRGDGTFEDVTDDGRASAPPTAARSASSTADVNGDGWIDIYVANDGMPNQLWMNQQRRHLQRRRAARGRRA